MNNDNKNNSVTTLYYKKKGNKYYKLLGTIPKKEKIFEFYKKNNDSSWSLQSKSKNIKEFDVLMCITLLIKNILKNNEQLLYNDIVDVIKELLEGGNYNE